MCFRDSVKEELMKTVKMWVLVVILALRSDLDTNMHWDLLWLALFLWA